VGDRDTGEAAAVRQALEGSFRKALTRLRAEVDWPGLLQRGDDWMRMLRPTPQENAQKHQLVSPLDEIRGALKQDRTGLLRALCGTIPFRERLLKEVRRLWGNADQALTRYRKAQDAANARGRRLSVRERALERRAWAERDAFMRWRGAEWVGRYTGKESQAHRDRNAMQYCGPGAPWVLVASNVGAEGIDLQTYTRRIVHYDLEWNPAKMEQREGRGDRIGRVLGEERNLPLDIYCCLVPRTYDERMFHQYVARERWHGVLLGKPAARMAKDEGEIDAPLVSPDRVSRLRLDLSA
jgi:hypothetical protein